MVDDSKMHDVNSKMHDVNDASAMEAGGVEPDVTTSETKSSTAEVDSPQETGTLVIEHRIANENNTRNKKIGSGLMRLLTSNVWTAIVISGSLAGCVFSGFEIPRMHSRYQPQIDRLEDQADAVQEELKIFIAQNNRFRDSNIKLRSSVTELEEQNEIFNASNALFMDLNEDLNSSVAELEAQNQLLSESNAVFKELHEDLEERSTDLKVQVTGLESNVTNLSEVNQALSDNIAQLNDHPIHVLSYSPTLWHTTLNNGDLVFISHEVCITKGIIVLAFPIIDSLQINMFRIFHEYLLVAINVSDMTLAISSGTHEKYGTYLFAAVDNWECKYNDAFRNTHFMRDENKIPIGSKWYAKVSDYTKERVLDDLCLKSDDFDLFLGELIFNVSEVPVKIVSSDYKRGMDVYLQRAFMHYFGGDGLTSQDWYDAEFDCELLPEELKFDRTRIS
eukprot:CAMPEP_0195319662 /NCGR_PEP_ID=MMETSP0708-20121125/5640_1 /TAXON_ID=33640 /ORGANISM="Asterionellopsis glacialis, Strain CCMP134" /LENGTH=447 /DNA_ID=CAMNT_0040385921 /DNA_START=1160 /DNA_END=2506 /DNA_ORIENTATION=-